jgi:hypothetical protein
MLPVSSLSRGCRLSPVRARRPVAGACRCRSSSWLMIVCGLLAGGIRRGCLGAGAPVSGAPGGSWVYVLRPVGRRPGRAERGRIRAGGELVELWPGRRVRGLRVSPPPRPPLASPSLLRQGGRPPPSSGLAYVIGGSCCLPGLGLPPSLVQTGTNCASPPPPPPAFRTDVRSGGGIPNPALTHPSDNAGANPLTKATFQ